MMIVLASTSKYAHVNLFSENRNHADNQNWQSEFRSLCNKILLLISFLFNAICIDQETQGAFKGRWKVKKSEIPGSVSCDSCGCFMSSRTKPILSRFKTHFPNLSIIFVHIQTDIVLPEPNWNIAVYQSLGGALSSHHE